MGIFACSGCSFPSQATRGFKTPGTQETTLTLPIVSIHLPRLAFLSSPSPPCLRQAPDTSQSLMVVSGPPMGLRPSLDTWCLPRDPLGSPWRFRPQLFGSRWVRTGQEWERHIVGRRELNNTWHLPPWTCSCDLPPPSVPTPYVPELLSPTVRGQPSPHPHPPQSQRAENITASSREVPHGASQSHRPSTAAVAWLASPLLARTPLGLPEQAADLLRASVSPSVKWVPSSLTLSTPKDFNSTKIPWSNILRGGSQLGPRFI